VIVQTPGISQFFDCTPLDPVGWAIATGSAAAATSGALLVPALARRLTSGDGRSPAAAIREELSERPMLRLVAGGGQGEFFVARFGMRPRPGAAQPRASHRIRAATCTAWSPRRS
jgi:hypothetical protein